MKVYKELYDKVDFQEIPMRLDIISETFQCAWLKRNNFKFNCNISF
jgi:hypothetical protein